MEPLEIIKLMADAPLSLVLIYLIVQERKEHAATRLLLHQTQQHAAERYTVLIERVVQAMERLDITTTHLKKPPWQNG